MKTIYDKIDKELVQKMPNVVFDGPINVIVSEFEARKAVDYLLAQDILGVDTETRPSFRRGTIYHVSLLQVASRDRCFLFRINHTGITPDIKRLLEDVNVPKIGLSLHDDIHSLHQITDFQPGNFIDLQDRVCEIGVKDKSLQKLYANFFGQRISKRQRLTNWEADILTEKQKQYAAIDAWSCIMLYDELIRLEQTGDYQLIVTQENEQDDTTETGQAGES